MRYDAVIFDLGGVVLDWEPERAFEQVLPADDVPALIERIGFHAWNSANDSGRDFAQAEQELIRRFPADAAAILAYRKHFTVSLTGMVPGTSAVIAELNRAGVPIVALTNWSGETFPTARDRFGILNRFAEIVVSGDERLAKPDPEIFAVACTRAGLEPGRTVFIDDSPANVEAADRFGLHALLFNGADQLRGQLESQGLLPAWQPVAEPVFHWAVRSEWERAQATGDYPWSGRGIGYEQAGFVHCSFAGQLALTRARFYADLTDADLILLRLPDGLPVVVEDGFPHLFAPLPVGSVAEVDQASASA